MAESSDTCRPRMWGIRFQARLTWQETDPGRFLAKNSAFLNRIEPQSSLQNRLNCLCFLQYSGFQFKCHLFSYTFRLSRSEIQCRPIVFSNLQAFSSIYFNVSNASKRCAGLFSYFLRLGSHRKLVVRRAFSMSPWVATVRLFCPGR